MSSEPSPAIEPDVDRRYFPLIVALVLLLSGTSGIIDAVAYQRFGVFVSNQTGNLVVVAVSVTSGREQLTVGLSIVALVTFIVGVFLAMALRKWLHHHMPPHRARQTLLLIEALLILVTCIIVFLIGEQRAAYVAVALLSLSQAIQGIVIMRIVGVAIQTVVINTALVQSATWYFEGRRRAATVAFSTPIGYFAGAALGALLIPLPRPAALSSAVITAGLAFVVARDIRVRGAAME